MAVRQYEITSEQETALGQIVADNFGANFQTSVFEKYLAVYFKIGPTHPVISNFIDPDGTVVTELPVNP